MLGGSVGGPGDAPRRMVRRGHAIFRRDALARLGTDQALHPLGAPSRAIDDVPAILGTVAVFDLRTDRGHRRPVSTWRPRDLPRSLDRSAARARIEWWPIAAVAGGGRQGTD